MKKTILLQIVAAFLVWMTLASTGFAKRSAPPEVPSVTIGDIEFRAPAQKMGYIEAHDAKTNDLLWSRQIYVVVKVPEDFFAPIGRCNRLRLRDGNALHITNEAGSEFSLDVTSLEVKTLKGSVRTEKKPV